MVLKQMIMIQLTLLKTVNQRIPILHTPINIIIRINTFKKLR